MAVLDFFLSANSVTKGGLIKKGLLELQPTRLRFLLGLVLGLEQGLVLGLG